MKLDYITDTIVLHHIGKDRSLQSKEDVINQIRIEASKANKTPYDYGLIMATKMQHQMVYQIKPFMVRAEVYQLEDFDNEFLTDIVIVTEYVHVMARAYQLLCQ